MTSVLLRVPQETNDPVQLVLGVEDSHLVTGGGQSSCKPSREVQMQCPRGRKSKKQSVPLNLKDEGGRGQVA